MFGQKACRKREIEFNGFFITRIPDMVFSDCINRILFTDTEDEELLASCRKSVFLLYRLQRIPMALPFDYWNCLRGRHC